MSNQSSPDNEWLDSLYPKGEASPAHLDERLREAAHDAVKPGLAKWYGMGAAAVVVLAVMLTFVAQESPRDAQDMMPAPVVRIGAPSDGAVASQESGERDARMTAEMARARVTKDESKAKLAQSTPTPISPHASVEAMPAARQNAAGASIEEIVVTGSRITADESDTPHPSLLDCQDKPSDDVPVFCRADDGSAKVFDPKSGDCPAVLPISLAESDALDELEVVSTDPRTIVVKKDEYVCREGAWIRNRDSGND